MRTVERMTRKEMRRVSDLSQYSLSACYFTIKTAVLGINSNCFRIAFLSPTRSNRKGAKSEGCRTD